MNEGAHSQHSEEEISDEGKDYEKIKARKSPSKTVDAEPNKEHKSSRAKRKWAVLGGIGMGAMMVLMMVL